MIPSRAKYTSLFGESGVGNVCPRGGAIDVLPQGIPHLTRIVTPGLGLGGLFAPDNHICLFEGREDWSSASSYQQRGPAYDSTGYWVHCVVCRREVLHLL